MPRPCAEARILGPARRDRARRRESTLVAWVVTLGYDCWVRLSTSRSRTRCGRCWTRASVISTTGSSALSIGPRSIRPPVPQIRPLAVAPGLPSLQRPKPWRRCRRYSRDLPRRTRGCRICCPSPSTCVSPYSGEEGAIPTHALQPVERGRVAGPVVRAALGYVRQSQTCIDLAQKAWCELREVSCLLRAADVRCRRCRS